MHPLLKTIDYLSEFFSSHYDKYFDAMRDVGKPNVPEAFEGENEIVQGIRNIVFALEEEYSDLTIPKGFSSPDSLRTALHDSVSYTHLTLPTKA